MPPPSTRTVTFDDALCKYIGQFGPAQRRVFGWSSVLWIPNALFILLMVRDGSALAWLMSWQGKQQGLDNLQKHPHSLREIGAALGLHDCLVDHCLTWHPWKTCRQQCTCLEDAQTITGTTSPHIHTQATA